MADRALFLISRLRASVAAGLIAVMALQVAAAPAVRVKDLARLDNVRENQLVGYGLVVGLAGTGDSNKSVFTVLSVLSLLEKLGVPLTSKLQQFGITLQGQSVNTKNLAAVIVTAQLPPYASSGQKLDITVSAIGDAEDLSGGVLLQTPMQAGDGKIYAVAQGAVTTGGANVTSGVARQVAGSVHKTTARIPGGALIERELRSEVVAPDGTLTWVLNRPDFATASRLAESINRAYSPSIARAENAERVRVVVPQNFRADIVPFIARMEDLLVSPDAPAKVVVNERTGTIVFGENARISLVAVAQGGLAVTIQGEEAPNAGRGAGLAAATVTATEETENALLLPEGSNVKDLVRALNAIGATPKDIIAVLQAVSAAGALHAQLEFI